MYVEECCTALLKYILPEVDKNKSGLTIEIGVGTFHFYCSMFKQLGFEAIAVEPIPNEELKRLCLREEIQLIESCITKIDGTINIYMGTWEGAENTNLCSTRSDWWGSTSEAREVPSLTLISLLQKSTIAAVTCMKIDVEGAELEIIEQFLDIPIASLPKVMMFEYGGGTTKATQQGGWSPEIYNGTLKCLEILRALAYQEIIVIDSSKGFLPKVYNLSQISLFDDIFPETSDYGNIIATRDRILSKLDLDTITSQYGDDYQPHIPTPQSRNIFAKISNKIKNIF